MFNRAGIAPRADLGLNRYWTARKGALRAHPVGRIGRRYLTTGANAIPMTISVMTPRTTMMPSASPTAAKPFV